LRSPVKIPSWSRLGAATVEELLPFLRARRPPITNEENAIEKEKERREREHASSNEPIIRYLKDESIFNNKDNN
jgi:hypothetical protein